MNEQATVLSENSVTRKLSRNSYSVIRHFKRDAEKTQFTIKPPQWIPVLKNVKIISTKLTLRLVHKKACMSVYWASKIMYLKGWASDFLLCWRYKKFEGSATYMTGS